jgi:hypothetical protein
MKKLAAKNYYDGLTETSDFEVMFIPRENFYVAAVKRDPAGRRYLRMAAAQRVINRHRINSDCPRKDRGLCLATRESG